MSHLPNDEEKAKAYRHLNLLYLLILIGVLLPLIVYILKF